MPLEPALCFGSALQSGVSAPAALLTPPPALPFLQRLLPLSCRTGHRITLAQVQTAGMQKFPSPAGEKCWGGRKTHTYKSCQSVTGPSSPSTSIAVRLGLSTRPLWFPM